MELLKKILYELHNGYININYELECVINLLERYESYGVNYSEKETLETMMVLKLSLQKIKEKMDEKNNELDSASLNIGDLV